MWFTQRFHPLRASQESCLEDHTHCRVVRPTGKTVPHSGVELACSPGLSPHFSCTLGQGFSPSLL